MPVGLAAGNALGFALETAAAPGVYVPPVVWIPYETESLDYTEDRYMSDAIRQQTIINTIKPGYYHVEGDVTFEVDTRFTPYFLHASRMGVTKTGAASPWTYTFAPTSGAQIPSTNRTASLTIIRNNVPFGFTGCVVTSTTLTIDTGILKATFHVIGRADAGTGIVPGTPAFVSSRLLGADTHTINTGDGALASAPAGATTMAGTTVNQTFSTFTITLNSNGAAQQRINQARSAAFISMGLTDATVEGTQDFLDRTERDKFVNATNKRLQLLSVNNATDTFAFNLYNSIYTAFPIGSPAWGDLITSDSTLTAVSSGGTNPAFDLNFVTDQAITVT